MPLSENSVGGKGNSIFWIASSGWNLQNSVKPILRNIVLSVNRKWRMTMMIKTTMLPQIWPTADLKMVDQLEISSQESTSKRSLSGKNSNVSSVFTYWNNMLCIKLSTCRRYKQHMSSLELYSGLIPPLMANPRSEMKNREWYSICIR